MKICIAGIGSIGKRHIRNLKMLSETEGFHLEVHALRSSAKKLEPDIGQLVKKEWYSMPECTEVFDAVFITNPTWLHYTTLVGFLDKSQFFFVEKPVFHDCSIDLSVFEHYPDHVYYTACPLRYTKVIQRAKEIVGQNKVFSVRSLSSSYLPDWRPGTDYRKAYSAYTKHGGGVRADLIHEWDYLAYLFGYPSKVFQLYGRYSGLEIESEDLAVYIAEYEDKLVELHLDYFGRQARRSCEIMTAEDLYLFDIAGSRIMKNGKLYEQFDEAANDKYLEELRYFCRLMQGREQNENDICRAVKTMRTASSSGSVQWK